MAVQESQVVALELEKVMKKVPVAYDFDDKFFAHIKKRQVETISNRQMRVPINIRTGGNFGYFDPDGGDLGRGGGPTFERAVLNSVFLREAIEYTKLTQWATDDSRKSVVNAVREMTARAMDELRRQLDSQMMQAGNGVIGTVTTDTPAGGENVIVLTTDGFGARLMRYGQPVQIWDSTLATNRGSATITYYDIANNTIKLSPQIGSVTGGDLIVTAGLAAPGSLPAIYGVPYHHSNASTGTWLGFSRVTTPEIRSNRVNASSNPLALPFPRRAINAIGNRVGIDNNFRPDAWMHPCQMQAYEEIGQLVSIIQKQAKDEKLNMYFGDMQMAGANVKASFSWDKTRIDFVVDSVWGRGEILPIGFYKTDGRSVFEIRGASGGIATADIFYLVVGTQFFVDNPAATAYIDALSVPSGY
jgi:hypothetical protein